MTLNRLVMRPDQLDDNRSVWLGELPPYERLPALRGDQTADVAIVGGGFTGVSTAWHLSRALSRAAHRRCSRPGRSATARAAATAARC